MNKIIISILLSTSFIVSCNKSDIDKLEQDLNYRKDEIVFDLDVTATKATINTLNSVEVDGFAPYAKDANGEYFLDGTQKYIYSGNSWSWESEDYPRWPADANDYPVTFYAAYPKQTITGDKVNYKIDKDAEIPSYDLLVANSGEIHERPLNNRLRLNFEHVTSKIKVMFDLDDEVTMDIRALYFSNIATENNYDCSIAKWDELSSDVKNAEYAPFYKDGDYIEAHLAPKYEAKLSYSGNYLSDDKDPDAFMLPQTLSDDAYIYMLYTSYNTLDNSLSIVGLSEAEAKKLGFSDQKCYVWVKFPIQKSKPEWKAGKGYLYYLSIGHEESTGGIIVSDNYYDKDGNELGTLTSDPLIIGENAERKGSVHCTVEEITTNDWDDVPVTNDDATLTLKQSTSNTLTISSYGSNHENSSNKYNLNYTSSFSTDGGKTWESESPSWLKVTTRRKSDKDCQDEVKLEFDEKALITSEGKTINLATVPPVESYDDNGKLIYYNLASSTGDPKKSENSSNCYVVNGPGYYSIPAYYGNALKNGVKNEEAYFGINNKGKFEKCAVNYKGEKIDGFKVKDAKTAEVLWADKRGMIEIVAGDNGQTIKDNMINFRINADGLGYGGNALIAAKNDDDVIVWSWHIWITPNALGDGDVMVQNSEGKNYSMMPINIGWVATTTTTKYGPKTVIYSVTQEGSGLTQQLSYTFAKTETDGYNTFYQAGRKDPFIIAGSIKNQNTKKQIYDKDDNVIPNLTISKIDQPFDFTISNPNALIYGSSGYFYGGWCSSSDQWLSLLVESNVKTVYDPCPNGYMIPPLSVFDSFITMDDNTGSRRVEMPFTEFQKPNAANNWYYGYQFFGQSAQTIYVPSCGYLDANGSVGEAGIGCDLWSSDNESNITSTLYISSGQVSSGKYFNNSYASNINGIAVRAVREY